MNLLFITRKYPPMIGGMEKVSFSLAKEFSKRVNTTLITWGRSQKFLPIILPYFFLKALYLIPSKKINHIHLGDALLSPLGLVLKTIFGIKTTVTINGLDIVFKFPPYQFIVPRCVAKLDKVICISNATLDKCIERGIPKEKCIVIPCGVYPGQFKIKATKKDLEEIVGESLETKKVIITVGRLVKRKGVYWFIKKVFPNLNRNIIYLVVGEGPEKNRIEKLVSRLKLEERVFLLGEVPEGDLKVIYNTSDLFVMPNIKVKGDIEGFGIVALEASSSGLPVIASDIEGIRNSVVKEKTGRLLNSMNHKEFIKAISNSDFRKKNIEKYVERNFSWDKIGKKYLENIL